MGKKLERLGEVWIVDETNGFGLDFVEEALSVDFGAPSQTWEQYSTEGRIRDLYIVRR